MNSRLECRISNRTNTTVLTVHFDSGADPDPTVRLSRSDVNNVEIHEIMRSVNYSMSWPIMGVNNSGL